MMHSYSIQLPALFAWQKPNGVKGMLQTRLAQALKLYSLLVLLALSGCGASAEEKQTAYLQRGDQYFEEEKYREAIIEYLNIIQVDPENQHANERLGLAHFRIGQLGQALRFLQKARAIDTDNPEVGLNLAYIYLLTGRAEEAKEETTQVLAQDPDNFGGLRLLAEAASSPQDIDHVLVELERLRSRFDDQAIFHFTMGKLHIKKQDFEKAEEAYQQAVEKDPDSIDAHLALGAFYTSKKELERAEEEFKKAAEMASMDSPAQIDLANFYVEIGKTAEAKSLLQKITEEAPDYIPAWRGLSEIAFTEQLYDEVGRALDEILARNPQDPDALQARGEAHLANGETEQAEERFREVLVILQKIVNGRPDFTAARYRLAQIHLFMNEFEQARIQLQEIRRIAPNPSSQLVLLLSQLNLQTGDSDTAIRDLEALVENQPELSRAHDLLGTAYLAKKDPSNAAQAFARCVDLVPNDARARYLLGLSLLQLGNLEDGRRQLEASLSLAPAYIDPLAQIVSLELASKNTEMAIARITKQMEKVPDIGAHRQLLGMLHRQNGNLDAAESAFLKAVNLDPSLERSYRSLASIYVETNRVEQAITKTEEALATDADNQEILMLAGQLYQIKGDNAGAEKAYQKLLELNPASAFAANNLAYIYSEREETREKALELAETARKVAPEEPLIADTLAWILYKRGTYERALSLSKESVTKIPNNAEVQYHLGMVYYKLDDKEAAWLALNRALEISSDFPGVDEARTVLEELKQLQ